MARYKIIVAYDGTDYYGWQFQPNKPTIVGDLQKSFERAFHQNIDIVGASRTDAGVHALGQVASFSTDFVLDGSVLYDVWQRQLPSALNIRSLEMIDDTFHPQRNVIQKTYYYHFFLQRPLPCNARYGWYYQHAINIDKLIDCLNIFIGTHDFRSFCTGYERENTVRTIDTITVDYVPLFKVYRIAIRGPGFLRYMIRRIVGASLLIASTDRFVDELKKALKQKADREINVSSFEKK